MQREVTGEDKITWTCAQAYSGLSDNQDNKEAARVDENNERVRVVCTPSGGAKSVQLELPEDWESSLTDEDLLRQIEEHRET
jgi:hypothetical protein